MNITLLCGAHDYVVIKTPTLDLSVLLDCDTGVQDSLTASALQMRSKAAKLIAQAELIEGAARQLARETEA